MAALVTILVSCKVYPEDSIPQDRCFLNLQVFDKNGKEMVSNIPIKVNVDDTRMNDVISPPKVSTTVTGTSSMGGAFLDNVVKIGEYQSVTLLSTAYRAHGAGFSVKLIQKLSYYPLFGNLDEHTIESEWELLTDDRERTKCKSVKFDGKVIPVTKDPNVKDPHYDYYLVVINLE